jgi:hypothetical protein
MAMRRSSRKHHDDFARLNWWEKIVTQGYSRKRATKNLLYALLACVALIAGMVILTSLGVLNPPSW